MKRNITRFLSVAVSVVLLVVLCVPAFASSGLQYEQKVTWWHWVTNVPFLKDIAGYTLGEVCTKSEDGYHHANSYQEDLQDGYYKCVCTYCGHEFTAYESDLNQSYQEQVSDLPVSCITSNGSFVWYPMSSFKGSGSYYFRSSTPLSFLGLPVSKEVGSSSGSFDLSPSLDYFVCNVLNYGRDGVYVGVKFDAVCPVSGSYRSLGGTYCSYSLLLASYGVRLNSTLQCDASGYFDHYDSGHLLEVSSIPYGDDLFDSSLYGYGPTVSSGTLNLYITPYEVIPDTAIDTTSGGQYSITTRPTVIDGGNYGIVGDDNNITTVTNTTQIINEGDNLYYNPATGQTQTITDWTYNYDGRIYNITLDTGDTVSVEYGDENITIVENTTNEGDTIVNNYTIYYMIDGSGSGESHTHEWYKTGERQATCLVPAQRTYTCSICGEQKTETDPVLGHSWHAIQTVTTQYDEKGIQTQEGYTIYECERCGEQYKSTNNTGPPPTGGGGSGGGTSENIFTGIFGLIWDFFTFLFDLFSEFVVGGIKGFISGLKDAGSSFFSILNPFDWGY